MQSASAEVEGLQATLKDVRLCNTRLRSKLQQQSGVLRTLREKKAEKESALFLRKHLAFTQQQKIAALRDAVAAEENRLRSVKEAHTEVVGKLEVSGEGETGEALAQPFVCSWKGFKIQWKYRMDQRTWQVPRAWQSRFAERDAV